MKQVPFKSFLSRRRYAAIAGALEKVIQDLDGLAGSTEREFLDLGRQLQEIVPRAREQRAEITGLVDALARTGGQRLAELLGEISRWSGQAAAGETRAKFEQLVPVVRAVGDPLRSLNNAVRMLRVTGVITRVESARLGSQSGGFDALASEVGSLANAIDEKSNAIHAAVGGLCELLVKTEKATAEIDSREQADVRVTTAACTESLHELERESQRMREVTRSVAERYDRFTTEVGNMVTRLQSHDSTRQRVEHITEALGEAAASLRAGASAGELIELQTVQLRPTSAAFLAALEGIQSDLAQFAEIIADSTRMARELLCVRKDSREGFLKNLERRLMAIAGAVTELAESRDAAARVAADVQQACTRMSGFVAEIEIIGVRMLRLALNAEIRAVHLAETGVVMEAVAEGIRATSDSASESARLAGQALRDVEATASTLSALTVSGADAAQAAALASRIRQIISELEAADADSTRVLASIAAGSDQLTSQIASLGEGITAGRTFGHVSQECLVSLEDIAAALRPAKQIPKTVSDGLVSAIGNYTMHAERKIHNEFVGVVSSTPETDGRDGSEFGDNVELF